MAATLERKVFRHVKNKVLKRKELSVRIWERGLLV